MCCSEQGVSGKVCRRRPCSLFDLQASRQLFTAWGQQHTRSYPAADGTQHQLMSSQHCRYMPLVLLSR